MNHMTLLMLQTAVIAALAVYPVASLADRDSHLIKTPHNLSSGGGKGAHDIRAAAAGEVQGRVCIFCHAPHHSTSVTPLWSRDLSSTTYTLYKPARMSGVTINPPQGASKLCLSCHDGTIALGLLAGTYNLDPALKSFSEMITETDPRKNPNLGTDLSDDHPISFIYNTSNPELVTDVEYLKAQGIRLDPNGYVECNSCHNPHNNQFGNFLVKNSDTNHDALCTTCHIKAGWDTSDSKHRTGGGGSIAMPIPGIAADGCINCHLPHGAPGRVSLQKGAVEENTCYLTCHKNPPFRNIFAEFSKQYRHHIENYDNKHSAKEDYALSDTKKHVECVDCHNPHRAGWAGAPLAARNTLPSFVSPPRVTGPLEGVRTNNLGQTAEYEFEICLKCHSGSGSELLPDISVYTPNRQFLTYDEGQRFSSGNFSNHPVTVDRPVASTGRSLKFGVQAMKRIYCIDCHSPHGADEPHILSAANEGTFPSLASEYTLCFGNCHDKAYLYNDSPSAFLHKSHVQDHAKKAPCSVCHDPHGVPVSRGAGPDSGVHLINFDTGPNAGYTGPAPVYSASTRSCTVAGTCHAGGSPRGY